MLKVTGVEGSPLARALIGLALIAVGLARHHGASAIAVIGVVLVAWGAAAALADRRR